MVTVTVTRRASSRWRYGYSDGYTEGFLKVALMVTVTFTRRAPWTVTLTSSERSRTSKGHCCYSDGTPTVPLTVTRPFH